MTGKFLKKESIKKILLKNKSKKGQKIKIN